VKQAFFPFHLVPGVRGARKPGRSRPCRAAVIDFSEELIGARFVINNPNATSSCGCGTSFSV
jgi:hypothetical protein